MRKPGRNQPKMPSGAKRRQKAAKKKKGNEANKSNASSANTSDTNDNNSHGYDDPKSQDERDSEGGEVGTLVSQVQQNNHHPFIEGNLGRENREASSVKSLASENKSMDEVTKSVESTEVLGGEEILGKEDSTVVQIDWQLKPDEDLDSKDVTVEDYRRTGSSSDDESQAAKKEVKEETGIFTSEPTSNGKESEPVNFVLEEVVPQRLAENASVEVGKVDGVSAEETASASNVVEPVIGGSSIDKLSVSDAVELGLKEIEEKLVTVSNGGNRVPAEENEEKVLPPSSDQSAETSNVAEAEHTRDSEIPQVSEKQPLVATNPPLAQRASWLSCCGLFEVFSGSGR